MIDKLHLLNTDIEKPRHFTYPFFYEPHPLSRLAAEEVQREIAGMNISEGKMFGVLVVEMPSRAASDAGEGSAY
jgi:tRNA pseudouridine32 synthase/23S rRNA pseudouridine746 synthase